MASEGPNYPSSATTGVGPSGDNDWVTASNVGANDGSEAQITHATYDAGDDSYALTAHSFGFSIPAGATIDGIVVEIERRCFAGAASDAEVSLTTTGGYSTDSDNKAAVGAWPGTPGVATYGSSSDDWNYTGTVSTINSVNFGVNLIVNADGANTDIGVDFIRVTIYYTEAAVPVVAFVATRRAAFSPDMRRPARTTHARPRYLTRRVRSFVKQLTTGTTYQQGIDATTTLTASFVRQVGKTIGATTTATPLFGRAIGKTMSAGTTLSAAFVRGVSKTLDATTTVSPALSRAVTFLTSLPATTTVSPAISRAVTYLATLPATTTLTPALARVITKTLAATTTLSASFVRQVGFTLNATTTLTVGFVRQVGKAIEATTTVDPALVASKLYMRAIDATTTLTAGVAGSATFVRNLASTTTLTPAFTRQVRRTLAVASTLTVGLQRQVQMTLAATTTVSPVFQRAISKTLAATTTVSAALSGGVIFAKALAASTTHTVAQATQFIAGGGAPVARRWLYRALAMLRK